jgi:hypothetical protein
MKVKKNSINLCCFALVLWGGALEAQTMPQDHWFYNQHQFSGPDPSQNLGSIAIGSGGVYVGRGGTAVWQFTEQGVYVGQFGNFASIVGIACDSTGNVYVLDATNSSSTLSVNVFDSSGNFLRQWGSPGTNDGQFSGYQSGYSMLAIDTNDQIYVCDPGNTRVQVFDTQGNFLRKWGSAGALPSQFATHFPQGIAANPNGQIYVANQAGSFQVFDSVGNYIKSSPLQNGPIAISSDGLLAGVYAYWNSAGYLIYDNNFNLLTNFVTSPSYVNAVAFNKRGDLFCNESIATFVNGVGYEYSQQVVIYEREYSSVQNPPTPPAIPAPIVLATSQRTNTAWLDVDFQITDADSNNVSAAALAFINGGNTLSAAVPMSTFMENTATNLGTNVLTNTKLHLTWNMGADWSIDYAQMQAEVLAKDSRNLMGFHWITVPTDGTNAAFQASSASVPESELLSIWYWFIATHNPGITFTNGTVTGLGGAYDGQVLANSDPTNGSATTSAGRAFAYAQMGVRAITQAEINRINAGNYGFTSVDANSVVKLP